MTIDRRKLIIATAVLGSGLAAPSILRAQSSVIRWGEALAPTHPQVQMAERVAKQVKESSGGRLDIQIFANGQLGSGKDMMEAVASGALQMTTDGAGALAAFLPALSLIEAPYLWRDADHLAKVSSTPIFTKLNDDLVAKRGMRILTVTYYGRRQLTTGTKEVRSPADMKGFKLRVPGVDVFRAMAAAWGAEATPIALPELYLALSQGAVDGQENPLPTIESAKFFEVQKFLVLTGHIITPRMVIANDAFLKTLPEADAALIQTALAEAAAWQDKELLARESTLLETLRGKGMTVIEPNVEEWRKPVLDTVPAQFAERWGAGNFEALQAL
jgi:tripartite ATP-independent transporter DctP family solute receptor